jgi:hypothetical protein
MVVSHIDGRLRIRDNAIKNPSIVSALEDIFKEEKGIIEMLINQRVGSMLIFYDSTITDFKGIIKIITPYLNAKKDPDKPALEGALINKGRSLVSRLGRRMLPNIGMLISLALTVISVMIGGKGLHGIAGLFFMGFLGMHILN